MSACHLALCQLQLESSPMDVLNANIILPTSTQKITNTITKSNICEETQFGTVCSNYQKSVRITCTSSLLKAHKYQTRIWHTGDRCWSFYIMSRCIAQ